MILPDVTLPVRYFYHSKADIFSLGIILFELFCSFGTEMERVTNIKDLRQGRLSHEFCQMWPEEVTNRT